jgi:hypothetical protein
MGITTEYISKELSKPIETGHPSKRDEARIARLEKLVLDLAESIDDLRNHPKKRY